MVIGSNFICRGFLRARLSHDGHETHLFHLPGTSVRKSGSGWKLPVVRRQISSSFFGN